MAVNTRAVALEVLTRCSRDESYSNLALDSALKKYEPDSADRALITALVFGVIERRITLDYYISRLSTMPMGKIEPKVLNILRMGLYQLAYLDRVPPHAAVNESVSLCPPRATGYANALLRAFLRERDRIGLPEDPVKRMSVEYSFPTAFCELVCADYGAQRAAGILSALNENPPLTLRVNTLATDLDSLVERFRRSGIDARVCDIVPDAITVRGTAFTQLPGFDRGLFFVQDAASQLCVGALGVRRGDFFIDVCSAPGSKSFGAAINMENEGSVLSCDLHSNKLTLVERGAEALGINIIKTHENDARVPINGLFGSADAVLCDVPCSGYGVIAKKPEIRYKDPEKCVALPDIQLAILKNCANYVKPGGTLVYSTCTILDRENGANVSRFLEENKDFVPEDFSVNGRDYHALTQLLPDSDRTDGFFIAKLRRLSSSQKSHR